MLVVLLAATAVPAGAAGSLDDDLELFLELFEGEFNNFQQISSQTGDPSHPWHHHTVRRVEAPAFGELVFYSRINDRGPDGPVVRRKVDVIEADATTGTIRQVFFAVDDDDFDPTKLPGMSPELLRAYPDGCEVVWRRLVDQFVGTMAAGDCEVVSRRSGRPMYIVAELVLAPDAMWHSEGGVDETLQPVFGPPGDVPFKLRRVTHYSCRVTHHDGDEVGPRLSLHDQGGTAELRIGGDQPQTSLLQLVSATELELTVRDSATETQLAAAWTEPEAERIGLAIGSTRIDCTRSNHHHNQGSPSHVTR
jgi:hypothetical protein